MTQNNSKVAIVTGASRGIGALILRLEAVLAFAVIAATTALTSVPPPVGDHGMSDRPGRHTVSARAGSFDLLLTVVPAQPGTNSAGSHRHERGRPGGCNGGDDPFGSVPILAMEEIARLMQHVGPGRYRLEGPELAVAGPWRLRIDLLVSDFEKQSAEMRVAVGSTSGTDLY